MYIVNRENNLVGKILVFKTNDEGSIPSFLVNCLMTYTFNTNHRLVLFLIFFTSVTLNYSVSYCEDSINSSSSSSAFYPTLFFFIVISSELFMPGSSLITIPLVIVILDNSPSTVLINDVNSISYDSLLSPEQVKLQAERELGNDISDFTAKVHNILIVSLDLLGIYFLPAYAQLWLFYLRPIC